MLRPVLTVNAVALAACIALVACGDDGGGADGAGLSEEATAGRAVARDNGCASCHGVDGQGDIGPTFVGLYESEVPLADGTTVVADDEYLRRSITEPDAERVEGFEVAMPMNSLDDADVDQVIAWIRELGDGGPK